MAEPASFEELDSAIGAVLDAETTNFFELAEMLGLDPKQDFAGADLSGTDLTGCDLAFANFAGTSLKNADLASVNLQGATLICANLSFANLSFSASTILAQSNDAAAKLEIALQSFARQARGMDIANIHARARELNIAVRRVRSLDRSDAQAREFSSACAKARSCASKLAQALALDLNRVPPKGRLEKQNHRVIVTIFPARDRSRSARRKYKSRIAKPDDRFRSARASVWRDLARTQAFALAKTFVLGADITGANVEGANFSGANVEGAVMTNCHGLSPAEIADLQERGAIFEDSPGDRSALYSPVLR